MTRLLFLDRLIEPALTLPIEPLQAGISEWRACFLELVAVLHAEEFALLYTPVHERIALVSLIGQIDKKT